MSPESCSARPAPRCRPHPVRVDPCHQVGDVLAAGQVKADQVEIGTSRRGLEQRVVGHHITCVQLDPGFFLEFPPGRLLGGFRIRHASPGQCPLPGLDDQARRLRAGPARNAPLCGVDGRLQAGTAPPPATQSAAPMAAARSTAASTVGNAACSCARTWPALLTATAA
ncbi:hypothetical protein G6F68_015950 [Rhizopus microsporus]|nr:hypothetical protein G6F68_015950 [Rhizopus microsporus]